LFSALRHPLTALLLLAALPAGAAGLTLKIATLAPDGTSWMQAMRASAEEVRERTDGRVRLRFYPGGIMGNDQSMLRKIRAGQLHGGAITGTGLASIDPDSQVYGLPFAFRSYDEVDYVRERIDPLVIEGLRRNGYVSYGISEGGFAYLMSNRPIHEIGDLEERKVWAPEGDKISIRAFQSVGISPIQLPLTDVLTGLQTGLIDTVANTPTGAIALQWHTRVKYLTDLPLLYTYGSLLIHEDALKSLSAPDHEILQASIKDALAKIDADIRRDNREARRALVEQGIELIAPSDTEMDQWQRSVVSATDQLAAEGVFSKQRLELLRSTLREYRSR
jgi:TRAP-type C4-dicarboxylate transport system substrate-binding protein